AGGVHVDEEGGALLFGLDGHGASVGVDRADTVDLEAAVVLLVVEHHRGERTAEGLRGSTVESEGLLCREHAVTVEFELDVVGDHGTLVGGARCAPRYCG